MRIRYVQAAVESNELRTISCRVPLWELPLLEFAHRAVNVLKEELIERDPPEAHDEYTRLGDKYRPIEIDDDGNTQKPVAAAYGLHGAGVAALARAIEAATVADPAQEAADAAPGDDGGDAPRGQTQRTAVKGAGRKKKPKKYSRRAA